RRVTFLRGPGRAGGAQGPQPMPQNRCTLGCKRTTAAAVARSVGIDEDKSLPHERLLVIQSRAIQIQETFWIDEKAGTKFFKHLVAVARLGGEAHGVRQTGATGARGADAKAALLRRHTFLGEQGEDFFRRSFRNVNFRSYRICDLSGHTRSARLAPIQPSPSPGWGTAKVSS